MTCFMWSIWILHFSHETFSSYWKWQLCNQSFNSRMELSISDHCVYLASSRTSEQRLKLSRWMRNELVLSNEHTELHSLIILYCVIWCYYYILCFNYFHYKFTLSYPENNLPPYKFGSKHLAYCATFWSKQIIFFDFTYVVLW